VTQWDLYSWREVIHATSTTIRIHSWARGINEYPRRVRYLLPLVLIYVSTLATVTQGVVVWDGGGAANNWSNALNWNPNGLPGSADDVTIGINVDTLVDQDFSIRQLDLSGGATADSLR
jgi:hypothetical protein